MCCCASSSWRRAPCLPGFEHSKHPPLTKPPPPSTALHPQAPYHRCRLLSSLALPASPSFSFLASWQFKVFFSITLSPTHWGRHFPNVFIIQPEAVAAMAREQGTAAARRAGGGRRQSGGRQHGSWGQPWCEGATRRRGVVVLNSRRNGPYQGGGGQGAKGSAEGRRPGGRAQRARGGRAGPAGNQRELRI